VESLKDIEKGMFHPVEINCGNDEIGKLRDAYNIMIKEIDRLIKRVIKEQKIKRKTELNILQEQIKPHFLYNTFDAISALILLEKNKEAYTMIKALGNFYKTSLSSGKEIIPINEEIKTVENYLTILKMRYKDIFTTEFHIDNEIVHYKIPKLILQPFVENAVYHGIKPKGETGIISITACQKENFILFIIEDTGVGMDEEVLQQISIQDDTKTTAHFGIRGTIERLKIFYGVKDVFSIESKKTIGTKVTLTIPIKGESEYV
jgi:two-component system sensor histidine kinase YesM